jgi:uncharacterized lipoprotein YddW (UPF0748 family)
MRIFLLLLLALGLNLNAQTSRNNQPPPVDREFRGAWVATVGNIDWPSKPGLPPEQQKAELAKIFDTAASLKLNAIIFQIRTSCDAVYESKIEPWSEYLTGQMGKSPGYDPLALAVELAHARGIELHAWFNPYRARYHSAISPVSANHVSKSRPELVRNYGKHLWLDPADKHVREYTTSVVLDVLRRYDVDGIHMDDYFYPYPESNNAGRIDFPDDQTWAAAQKAGVKMSRSDWRRNNVNTLIQELYAKIKAEKKWVKFGLSPFGIWQPGHPPQIKGFNQHEELYADAKLWINKGWVDYFAPQLYWAIDPPQQSYPALLKWWDAENTMKRHVWAGSNSARVGSPTNPPKTPLPWPAEEIAKQIEISRQYENPGHIHWNMSSLVKNSGGLADLLRKRSYSSAALVPASPWLDKTPPAQPKIVQLKSSAGFMVRWEIKGEPIRFHVLQTRRGNQWSTEILPAKTQERRFEARPDVVAVSALDRAGNLSPAAILAAGR